MRDLAHGRAPPVSQCVCVDPAQLSSLSIMGVGLTNQLGGYFGCSATRWWVYRCVAEVYGWQQAGTLAPLDHTGPWDGRYDNEIGQRVAEADALALSDAIERALNAEDLSKRLREAWGWRHRMDDPEDAAAWQIQFEFDHEQLAELRTFCRGGEFWIY